MDKSGLQTLEPKRLLSINNVDAKENLERVERLFGAHCMLSDRRSSLPHYPFRAFSALDYDPFVGQISDGTMPIYTFCEAQPARNGIHFN